MVDVTIYEDREFMIFNVSELNKIDFNQVLETDANTVRKSVDESIIFTQKNPYLFTFNYLWYVPNAIKYNTSSETLSLNDVAEELLGEIKKVWQHKHSTKINGDEWENYFDYNLQDSIYPIVLYWMFRNFSYVQKLFQPTGEFLPKVSPKRANE